MIRPLPHPCYWCTSRRAACHYSYEVLLFNTLQYVEVNKFIWMSHDLCLASVVCKWLYVTA